MAMKSDSDARLARLWAEYQRLALVAQRFWNDPVRAAAVLAAYQKAFRKYQRAVAARD
jgi:hypothetical protein